MNRMRGKYCCIFRIVSAILIFCASFPLTAGISFGSSDLNDADEVLFTVRQTLPGTVSYRSLFYVKITNGTAAFPPEIITCYPEHMELLSGGTFLQIRNRYGTARYALDSGRLTWQSQAESIPLNSMRLSCRSVSPDGKWSCYIQKTGYAEGKLVFENSATGKTVVLDEHTPFSYDSVPVKWAPDSSIFLYCRRGKIYFCDPAASLQGIQIDEKYREIGIGSINSVCWAGDNLFYIDGDMVYRIDVKGLYTAGLYSGIIGKGSPYGRLPEQFDSRHDIFSVNGSNTALFLIKSGRMFSYYSLGGSTCSYLNIIFSRPYTGSTGSLLDAVILWDGNGYPYVWMRLMPYAGGKAQAGVYKISDSFVPVLSVENSCRPVVSSDGTLAAFFSGSTVYVYNIAAWKRVGQLSGENMVSAVWGGNTVLYVGGDQSVRKWNIADGTSETLFLASASSGAWDRKSGGIAVSSPGGRTFLFDRAKKTWMETAALQNTTALQNTAASTQNGRYRVFCGTTPNELYENALYVRTLSGKAVTKAVYPESVVKTPARKKAAFVFDAYDSCDGLPDILAALNTYGVTGTFCLNGEFIRRYPQETKQIASTKNSCASLFFSTADLTSSSFIADENFIRRGLARNEDEFYQCTGSELSLLWHAPYYRVTDAVRTAGEKAGYTYIDVLNGGESEMTLEDAAEQNAAYVSASRIIDDDVAALKKTGGGIIPVTVGFARGKRTDYVYRNLDLLISAVLDEGFDIVSADELAD